MRFGFGGFGAEGVLEYLHEVDARPTSVGGRAGQGRAGQGRGRAGQGRAGQGKGRAGQGRAEGRAVGRAGGRAEGRAEGRAGQGRAGQGRAGKKKPSTDRLSQLVATVRCTRHNLAATYYQPCAILLQSLNPTWGFPKIGDPNILP